MIEYLTVFLLAFILIMGKFLVTGFVVFAFCLIPLIFVVGLYRVIIDIFKDFKTYIGAVLVGYMICCFAGIFVK